MERRTRILTVAVTAVWLSALDADGACVDVDGSFCIESAAVEAVLVEPWGVTARDETGSALVGPFVLWTFGDTLGAGTSNSASLSGTSDYWNQLHTVGADGLPEPLIRDTASEQLITECWVPNPPAHCVGGFVPKADCVGGLCVGHQAFLGSQTTCSNDNQCRIRVAHWPSKPIEEAAYNCEDRRSPYCQGTARILFDSYYIRSCFLCFHWIGTGMATLTLNGFDHDTLADRDAGYLFSAGAGGRSHRALLKKNGFLYVLASPKFGRVPIAEVGDPFRYRYWNVDTGSWVSSWNAATAEPNYSGSGSIAWNPYVGRYLSVDSELFTGEIRLQAAPQPQGPWTVSVRIPLPANTNRRQPILHPELDTAGGRDIRISYFEGLGGLDGQNPVLKVRLKKPGC